MNNIKIDNFEISKNSKAFIIAELSANHNGNLKTAIETIKAAKRAGANCIKLQTYTADTLTIDCKKDDFIIKGTIWDKENYYYIVGRKKKFIKLFGKRFDLKEVKSYLDSKGIKVRCHSDDTKLKISLYNNFKKKPYIKNLLSKYLNINPNYILVENNTVKNFKDFN